MSILQVLLNIPGGTYKHVPLLLTTTFVGYVPSNPSSALEIINIVDKHSINIFSKLKKTLWNNLPIVHKNVRLPQAMWRYPEVPYTTIFRNVPPHVNVIPLLGNRMNFLLSNSITFFIYIYFILYVPEKIP